MNRTADNPQASLTPGRFLKTHILYLALCGIVAGAVAWHASVEFASNRYAFESQLFYHQFGSEGLGYEGPNLIALTPLTSSRRVLEPAIAKLKNHSGLAEIDILDLEEAIRVEVPYESSLFTIQLDWPVEEQGVAVLNTVVQEFVRVIGEARRESIAQTLKGIAGTIRQIDSDMLEQQHSLQDFNSRFDILDVEAEMVALGTEIDLLQDRLTQSEHRLEGDRAKLAALTQQDSESPDGMKAASARKTMRMEELTVTKGLLSDEVDRIKHKAELDFHEKQFAIDSRMYEAQLITQTAYEASKHKLETLQSLYHPSLNSMRDQVDKTQNEIKQILESGDTSQLMAASSGSTLRAGVEMAIISGEVETRRLAEIIDQKRTRMKELADNRIEGQSYAAEVRTLSAERERLQRRRIDLLSVDVEDPIEFTVVQHAGPALYAVSSNQKKLFVVAFGICVCLLIGPLLMRDLARSQIPEFS